MLVTFQVALHYVRPTIITCFGHVTLLLSSNSWTEFDSRLVEIFMRDLLR